MAKANISKEDVIEFIANMSVLDQIGRAHV